MKLGIDWMVWYKVERKIARKSSIVIDIDQFLETDSLCTAGKVVKCI